VIRTGRLINLNLNLNFMAMAIVEKRSRQLSQPKRELNEYF